tara:strand:- start:2218 stop:2844 length:627 start_codon:yes stop_codon:yes gene_type:complete
MAEYTLTNTAAVVDASIQKVANATTTPLDGDPNMVTSGGVKAYVDDQNTALEAQILAIESELQNNTTGVSLTRTAEFCNANEFYQTVPLSPAGQPDYFTNNGNNTFTILEGNYIMWFSFNWRTYYNNLPAQNNLYLKLTTVGGMADFAGIGEFVGTNPKNTYAAVTLLDAKFKNVDQTTTFALQIRDYEAGNAVCVYVKDVIFTILKV